MLDEATVAVDPATEVRIARALEGLTRGRTALTIAHRLSTAEAADDVVVFDAGRVVERGRHADLVGAGGVYARLHASWAAQQRSLTAPRARIGAHVDRPDPSTALDPAVAARLKRDADGLVAAVVQQHDTGEVLMVGWMDDEALHRTLTTGRATFWSRSRQEYWRKGDTSGHVQHVRAVRARLRRRRAAGRGRPGRRRLPHRRPHLLRRRRPAAPVVSVRRRRPSTARPMTPTVRSAAGPTSTTFRELARDRRVIPVDPPAARRRRDAGRRLPQARRRAGRARSCSSRPSTAASGRGTRSSASARTRR